MLTEEWELQNSEHFFEQLFKCLNFKNTLLFTKFFYFIFKNTSENWQEKKSNG